ncbi:MAG: hypothetical protein GDA36_08340 [Rhodobacteraceae bacterium]|nr:hypothetical protein [Paracoccaceae bacterium]
MPGTPDHDNSKIRTRILAPRHPHHEAPPRRFHTGLERGPPGFRHAPARSALVFPPPLAIRATGANTEGAVGIIAPHTLPVGLSPPGAVLFRYRHMGDLHSVAYVVASDAGLAVWID